MGGWLLGRKGYELHGIEPPLISNANYTYLHRRHADLVPEFTRVIGEIKQDGTFDRLFARAIAHP